MNGFIFKIGEPVALSMSKEAGVVIGLAEYDVGPPQYYVRYVAADGRQMRDWFNGEEIQSK